MTLPFAGRILAGSFVLLQAVDFCFTHLLLGGARGDVYEANPLAMRILHLHGWSGLALFKVLCTFVGLAAVGLLWRRRASVARRVLLGMCLIMASVVVYSGTLLAGPEDPELAEMPQLLNEATDMDHHFAVLRQFDEAKTRLCQDLIAGRRDIPASVARMRQCLERFGPRLLAHHRSTLPDIHKPRLVLSYLYYKLSAVVTTRPGGREQLRRLRRVILNRYPDAILVEVASGEQRPWVASAD
jgi:hypothetical protein